MVVEPQPVEPMETNQRPYESNRPQRALRLNQSLYDMIQRPLHLTHNRRYRAYQNMLEPEGPLAIQGPLAIEGPLVIEEDDEPMNYPVVPYRRYDDYVHKCSKCKKNFPTRESLQNHTCLKCEDCEEIFHTRAAFEEHLPCRPSVYACAICGKNNPTRSAWRSHVKNMHQSRKDLNKKKKK